VLVLLGLVYGGLFNLDFANLRFPSVLGRIGLAWLGAAIIWMTVKKTGWRIGIAGALLIGYWVLHLFVAPDAPAGTDPCTKEGSLACYIDRVIMPNHLLSKGVYDPEGLVSTIPAIVTAMLGMFTGSFVKKKEYSKGQKTIWMFIAAAVLLGLGLLWDTVFPINKKLWTSSFVLVVGAYSVAMFALFYLIMDVLGWKKWAKPLKVVGLNSITIYMAQRIISFGGINNFFFKGLASLFPEPVGKVILAATYMLVCWLFLYFLYKKKIFLKV
jgi:predicted acyltransferase